MTRDWFVPALLILSLMLAIHRDFILDDAYIAFRYADFFAQGHGLVWYPGSNEFGYTNFLFTFLIGLGITLGLEPEQAARLITVPSFMFAMVLLYRLCLRLSCGLWASRAAALLVTTHFTLSSYATSGLETSFQLMWILAFYVLCFSERRNLYAIGIVAACALLVRLDSALLLMPGYVWLGWQDRRFKPFFLCAVIPIATLTVFLICCWQFYGYALPNSYYAKLELYRSFSAEGLEYVTTYVKAQLYVPLLFLFGIAAGARHFGSREWCLAALIALWLAYAIRAGGDFMEFRMLVPVIPFFYLLTLRAAQGRQALIALLLLLGLAGHYHHTNHFKASGLVADIAHFNDTMNNPRHNWRVVGKALGELFYTGSAEDVKIAVHTAGAIPYFSRLPTVDKYGLNDRWVAMHGQPGSRIPGHRRVAPFSYIKEQGVNILFPGLPQYHCPETPMGRLPKHGKLPRLLLPLEGGCHAVGYYLSPHDKIDSAIRAGKIMMVPS